MTSKGHCENKIGDLRIICSALHGFEFQSIAKIQTFHLSNEYFYFIFLMPVIFIVMIYVNDFPEVNGTPGNIQDPIDLLLAKCNFTNKRSTLLGFSTCNTHDLLLVTLHFVNKRSTVLVFSTNNTHDLLLMKPHLLFLINNV